jgi:hypothetical protein
MNQDIISGGEDYAILVDESPEESSGDCMPWTRPLHGRGRIDLAGDVMSGRKALVPGMDLNTALDVAGNWRSSHGYPLSIIFESLRRRAKKIDERAGRLKIKKTAFGSRETATISEYGIVANAGLGRVSSGS